MIKIKIFNFFPVFPSSEVDFDLYCFHKRFVGDGVCDDPNNNPYCFFDGGDCCLADSDTSFCKDCFCYLEENDTIDSGCAIFEWILFRAIGRTEFSYSRNYIRSKARKIWWSWKIYAKFWSVRAVWKLSSWYNFKSKYGLSLSHYLVTLCRVSL